MSARKTLKNCQAEESREREGISFLFNLFQRSPHNPQTADWNYSVRFGNIKKKCLHDYLREIYNPDFRRTKCSEIRKSIWVNFSFCSHRLACFAIYHPQSTIYGRRSTAKCDHKKYRAGMSWRSKLFPIIGGRAGANNVQTAGERLSNFIPSI